MRSNNKIDLRLLMYIALCLVLIGVALKPDTANSEEWTAPDLPCIPTVSDYDHAYKVEGGAFAVVWWCDSNEGLQQVWYTGTVPGAVTPQSQAAALLQLAGRDPYAFLQRAYKRASTPSEMELVKQLEQSHEPRCYVTGTAATTSVLTSTAQHNIGPAKVDAAGVGIRMAVGQRIVCWSRLPQETAKRYCEVRGSLDSKQRLIEGDAWAACRIERAPAQGWAQ